MSYFRFDRDTPNLHEQRGAAFIVMLVILVMGGAAILVSSLGKATVQIERDKITTDALVQAKEALIGYAVSDDTRPGEFPCPDVDGDGKLTLGVDYGGGGACTQYLGRLPWQTLGLSELRDGNNETLWYALSTDFRAGNPVVLNSNTKGTLLVYGPDGASLQTQTGYSAVAVIFAPGNSIGAQVRGSDAEKNTAANYLNVANGRNNAAAAGPFIAGMKSDTFNDQLLFITTKDLMPLVEQRVAGVVKKALTDYKTANGYYPFADSIGAAATYAADQDVNRGWLPDDATTGSTPDWAAGSPPQWFFDNQWYSLIYYSVAEDFMEDPGDCDDCDSPTLSMDGVPGVEALFFMPGTYAGARAINNLSHYLEDPENTDMDDDYVTPTSQAGDRDRIYTLP